jgi:hypothetical protein
MSQGQHANNVIVLMIVGRTHMRVLDPEGAELQKHSTYAFSVTSWAQSLTGFFITTKKSDERVHYAVAYQRLSLGVGERTL